MGLKGKATTGGDFEVCPPGNHPGVCIGLIDLGTHWESFQGQDEKKVRKILLVWELDVGQGDEEKRVVVGRDFNISYDKEGNLLYGEKSNLRKLLEGWRGKPYGPEEEVDPEAVVGRAGAVNVAEKTTKKGKKVSEVEGVKPLMKGVKPLTPGKEKVVYFADSDAVVPDMEWLPRIFGEKPSRMVERSLEHGGDGKRKAGAKVGAGVGGGGDDEPQTEDEIPF